MLSLRHHLVSLTAVLGVAATAIAQDSTTLTIHHFLSPRALTQTDFLEPWTQRVTEQSDGRLQFEIFPSMTLGGRPPELYSQVRDGVADIVWTVAGYTPGVFPRTEVFELPTVHEGSAVATNLAIQDIFADYLAEDFSDVQPLLIHVHTGNALHTVNSPIQSLAALDGMKLRTPTRTGAWMIESWNADPVGMPVPEVPQALSKGVVDGVLIPFEVVLPLKVHEMTRYSIEGPGGQRFGTAVFIFAMNKDRYQALPEDLRAVIDANSGTAIAEDIGAVWDDFEPRAQEIITSQSEHQIIQLDQDTMATFDTVAGGVVEQWVGEADSKGLDGNGLVQAAREAVARHSGK